MTDNGAKAGDGNDKRGQRGEESTAMAVANDERRCVNASPALLSGHCSWDLHNPSVDGGQLPSLLFFCYHFGHSFCINSVAFYSRNSNKENIMMFPLSQGIHPIGGRIYP
jgi:hypothetical protein